MTIRGFAYAVIFILIAVIAMANWSVITLPTTLNLLFVRVAAPLGVVMLLLVAVVVAIEVLVAQVQRLAWRREQRALRRELERQRALAEGAEASRLDALHAFVAGESAAIREQLDRLTRLIAPPRPD